jgi:hypothetical protein
MTKLREFFMKNLRVWSRLLVWGSAILAFFVLLKFFSYTLPMLTDSDPLPMGNVAIYHYNKGVQYLASSERERASDPNSYYLRNGYTNALNTLSQGYGDLADADGNIPAADAELAGKLQLAIGDCLYRLDKLDAAADAYAQALRHNPGLLAAKYNLELINKKIEAQNKPKDGQGNPGDKGKPGQNGKGDKGDGKGQNPGQGKDGDKQQGQGQPKDGDGKNPGDGKGKGQDGKGQQGKQPGGNQPGDKQPGDKQPGQKQPGAKQPGGQQPGGEPGDQDSQGDQSQDPIDQFHKPGSQAGKGNGKGI